MERGRHTDDNRVNVSHFQHVAIIRMADGSGEIMPGLLSPVGIRLRERDEVHFRQMS
jgi:hypothetical protein